MSNFIMVPVPEDRVQEVYSLLARDPQTEKAIEAGLQVTLSHEWSDDEIQRGYSEATGHIRQVLGQMAENQGQRFHSAELYEGLGLSSSQWRGVMGAFGKKVRNRYGKSTKPFDEGWDEDAGSMYYEMPAGYAKVILKGG